MRSFVKKSSGSGEITLPSTNIGKSNYYFRKYVLNAVRKNKILAKFQIHSIIQCLQRGSNQGPQELMQVNHYTTEPLCFHIRLIWFLVWFFTSQSTAMVMSGWSVHLTTLFSWASLAKRLTSTLCTYFHL